MFFDQYEYLAPDEEEVDLRTETQTVRSDFTFVFGDETDAATDPQMSGTDANDVIVGDEAGEVISGGLGADIIFGDGMTLADLQALDFALDAYGLIAAFGLDSGATEG